MLHAAICARLPHAGRMCLLERLEAWDTESITCIAGSHRDPANPLRAHGRLHAVCGVEYAAQAMALHGSLAPYATAMDGGSAENAGAVFPPTAMDGGRFGLLPSRGITPSMEGRSADDCMDAGGRATPGAVAGNAGAVFPPTAIDGGRFGLLPSRGITPSMEGRSADDCMDAGGRATPATHRMWGGRAMQEQLPGAVAGNAGAVFPPPAMGYLASVRDLRLAVARLDDIAEDLRIEARRVGGSAEGFMYSFEIFAGARLLLAGRAMVKLVNSGVPS